MRRSTKDSLESLSKHVEPVFPAGKGFTKVEFGERYSLTAPSAFRMIHKLMKAGLIKKIGVRPNATGHICNVYDATEAAKK
jgi:hypothetical protein